jgi:acyl carrier protein
MHEVSTAWLSRTLAELGKLEQQPDPAAMIGALGLSSLALVTLQFRLQSEHGVAVSLEELSANQSIAALCDRLAGACLKENFQ